jgi:hypothetical protein
LRSEGDLRAQIEESGRFWEEKVKEWHRPGKDLQGMRKKSEEKGLVWFSESLVTWYLPSYAEAWPQPSRVNAQSPESGGILGQGCDSISRGNLEDALSNQGFALTLSQADGKLYRAVITMMATFELRLIGQDPSKIVRPDLIMFDWVSKIFQPEPCTAPFSLTLSASLSLALQLREFVDVTECLTVYSALA